MKTFRLKRIPLILSILLTVFQVVGLQLSSNENVEIFKTFKSSFYFALSFISYFVLFYIVISVLFYYLKKKFLKNENLKPDIGNENTFLFYFLIIFSCWLPYFIIGYPGIINPDSIYQLNQIMGEINFNEKHAVFHTFLIKIFFDSGKYFFNSSNLGVSLYIIFQMIVMSAIFSYSLSYLRSLKVKPIFIKISLLYFAIYPIHAIYSINMLSDVIFSGVLLLYVILLSKLLINSTAFLLSYKQPIYFIIISLVLVLIRHTGIYIFAITSIVFLLFKIKNIKKIAFLNVIIFVFFLVIKIPIYNQFGIEKGPKSASLSIPLQQMARTVKYHKNEIDKNEIEVINNFFAKDFEKKYNSKLSDPIKDALNEQYFSSNKMAFAKLWCKLFFKFPKTYVKSFLYGSYGYWYPTVKYSISYKYVHKNNYEIEPHYFKLFNKSLSSALIIKTIYKIREIPIVSLLFSIGFMFWILLIAFGYCIFTKRNKLALLFIPLFVLWLTAVASPVYAEFRYVYGLFTCLPLLLGITLYKKKVKN